MSKSGIPVPDYFYYYPKDTDQRTVTENRTDHMRSGRQEIIHELHTSDGISIWYSNVKLTARKRMTVEYPEPFVHIQYSLQCTSQYYHAGEKQPFARFEPLQYSVLRLPAQQVMVEWMPGKTVETFEINITPEFFERQLPEDHPFRIQLQLDLPQAISQSNLPITPQIQYIIRDLLQCNMDAEQKRVYVQAKTLELIAILLQQLKAFKEDDIPVSGVKPADLKKMHAAGQIVRERLDNPLDLVSLAHMVGTNECYLKRDFKKVFGNTVFGYAQQLRMERAKQLLLEEKKVSEVARLSGYSHVSHFSKAFKKLFGFPPGSVKMALCMWYTEFEVLILETLDLAI